MTAQERDQLLQFLAVLRQQRSVPKDALADGLIRDALVQQPDAPYWLVQRSMALQRALNATQAHLAQLQVQWDEQTARGPALTAEPMSAAAASTRPVDAGAKATSGETVAVQVAALAPAQPSPWGRGLLAQVSGTALGVTTGVVAGGLLLQGIQSVWGSDSALPDPTLALKGSLPTAEPDAGEGLWDLGDDWA